MRKIRKTTKRRYNVDVEPGNVWQKGMIITSWPSVMTVDLITFLTKPAIKASVTGSVTCQEPTKQKSDRYTRMVALSDGTKVIFAVVGQLTVVQSD